MSHSFKLLRLRSEITDVSPHSTASFFLSSWREGVKEHAHAGGLLGGMLDVQDTCAHEGLISCDLLIHHRGLLTIKMGGWKREILNTLGKWNYFSFSQKQMHVIMFMGSFNSDLNNIGHNWVSEEVQVISALEFFIFILFSTFIIVIPNVIFLFDVETFKE